MPRPTSCLWPVLVVLCAVATLSSQPRSFVITGARVADGTGGALRQVDVRVTGDTIGEVGAITPREGETRVDGTGLLLAPRLHRCAQPLDRWAAE